MAGDVSPVAMFILWGGQFAISGLCHGCNLVQLSKGRIQKTKSRKSLVSRQVPTWQVPQGQLPGRTSAPRTSAGPNKFPQLSTSIQKRSGTDMYNCSRLKAICSVMQIQCNSNFASLPCKLNCQFMRSQYKVTNSLNHQDYHQLLLKHHHNLQQPLASKSVTTPYEIGTCSYDPYTNLNH